MSDTPSPLAPKLARADQVFPTLTPEQIARVAPHGHRRATRAGEVLIEAGDTVVPFFVVTAGQIEVVRPCDDGAETPIVVHMPGQFTGEVNMISGRRALFRARVREAGEAIELDHEQLVALVQTDAELSEIVLRAFILRRLELVASGVGDVVLIGSMHSPGTLRVREFLSRNNHPYAYIDLDRDEDVQALLDRFHDAVEEVPVLISRGDAVPRNPTTPAIPASLPSLHP